MNSKKQNKKKLRNQVHVSYNTNKSKIKQNAGSTSKLKQKLYVLGGKVKSVEEKQKHEDEFNKRRLKDPMVKAKFEVFEKGIKRLKGLEKELNALHTRGYEKDVVLIKKKLKSVALIPEIEVDIITLRKKINLKKKLQNDLKQQQIKKIKGELNSKQIRGILSGFVSKKSRKVNNEIEEIKREVHGRKIYNQVHELDKKVDAAKLDFHDQLHRELIESRNLLQKERQELKKQVLEIVSDYREDIEKERKEIIEKESQEINKQLLQEIGILNKKYEKDKKEIKESLFRKLLEVKKGMKIKVVQHVKPEESHMNVINVNGGSSEKLNENKQGLTLPELDKRRIEKIKYLEAQQGFSLPEKNSISSKSRSKKPDFMIQPFLSDSFNVLPKEKFVFKPHEVEEQKSKQGSNEKVNEIKQDFALDVPELPELPKFNFDDELNLSSKEIKKITLERLNEPVTDMSNTDLQNSIIENKVKQKISKKSKKKPVYVEAQEYLEIEENV